jgi:hypothetical protein
MKQTLKISVVFAAALAALSGCAAQDSPLKRVTAVHVHVSGESFAGERYRKDLDLVFSEGRWLTDYACTSRYQHCKGCAEVKSKILDRGLSESVVKALQDRLALQGSACCDHPFTQLKVEFDDKSTKSTTIGRDLLIVNNQRNKKEPDRDPIQKFLAALCQ